jgi:uncharacterized membrane protein
MKFIHPVFMVVLLASLYYIHRYGKEALTINTKGPEASQKSLLLAQHQKYSHIVTGLMFLGLIGGIVGLVKFMGVQEIFLKTRGHGFAGAIVIGLMMANIFVGRSVKVLIKEKARENLLRFHYGLFYFTVAASTYSLVSGLIILINGPTP